MSRSKIIATLGGSTLEDLVPQDFLQQFGLNPPGQYGMVCEDVGSELDALEVLGCTPFIHAQMEAPGWTEYGEKKKVKVDLAMGYTDGEQIELLGPGVNTDFYRDAIPDNGALALHHVCCFQNNIADLKRDLPDAGYPLCLEGGVNMGLLSTRFAYFDTRDELGVWLEITQYRLLGRHKPPTEAFITRLAKLQRRFS